MLLQFGASTRNVRWPRKSLIGIKNPYSDKASFFLIETSISTISRLQIELSLFYPNAENGEIRYGLFGETPTNVLLVGESVFGHVLIRPFHSIWSGNLQPATNNYTMDLAFQQTKY